MGFGLITIPVDIAQLQLARSLLAARVPTLVLARATVQVVDVA